MSKEPYKLPNVFVGCPYNRKFKFAKFKATLDTLPFKFVYANTKLESKHLLDILRNHIRTADFCMFDISMWNPNVALEIGLADGIGAEYYILVNRRLSSGVPSDIQGMQRIEYSNYDEFDEIHGLFQNVVRYLVKEETYPRKIYDEIGIGKNQVKKYYFALRVLAHFKDSKRLTDEQLSTLAKGTYLRVDEKDKVLNTMADMGLLANLDSKRGITLRKNLYRNA